MRATHVPSLSQTPRSVLLVSAGLSLVIHAGLLAALHHVSLAERIRDLDEPPVVTVTLLPAPQVRAASRPEAPPLPLKQARRTPSPPPRDPRPSLSVLPPVQPLAPSLSKPDPNRKAPKPALPSTPRLLRDERSVDALLARDLLKMAKPAHSSPSSTTATRMATEPATSPAPILPLSPSIPLRNHSSAESRGSTDNSTPVPHPSRRVLLAQGPSLAAGRTRGKVGIVRSVPPIYPRVAREAGWEGTVILRITVEPTGRASAVEIRKSSGYPILDQAAVEAVKSWQFRPASDGTIPIRTRVDIPVKFDLRNG